MAKIISVMFLVFTVGLLLLFSVTSGENCPVNPDCSCSGSSVHCYPKCGPSIRKFAASSKQFYQVWINGIRDITQIMPETFQGLSTTGLLIQYTGITGIGCDTFKGIASEVTELFLVNNHLESVPSCSFQHVTAVVVLRLTGNRISNLRKDAFNHLPDLENIYLNENKIEKIEIGTFIQLSELRYLNLGRNIIRHLEGSMFDGLTSLTQLEIVNSKIKSVHPKAFDGLESLIHLHLQDNEITVLDGTIFEHLINLQLLNLEGNAISSLPDQIFATTANLSHLYLHGNHLVSIPLNIFQNTPSLTTVYINNNRLGNLDPGTFRGLRNLWYVYLGDNQINDLQPGAFKNLPRLLEVHLDGNNLDQIRAGVFDNSTSLYSLDLSHNRISSIEIGSLESQHTSLQTLNLRSNKFTNKSWVTLTPLLTKLEVLYNLDLSNNPVGDLPSSVIESLKNDSTLSLRNCSVKYFPITKRPYSRLDLSGNTNIDNSFSYIVKNQLNISNSNLQSITIRPIRHYFPFTRRNDYVDAQRNEIKSVDIDLYDVHGYTHISLFQLSSNFISDSLKLSGDNIRTFHLRMIKLDLSYNNFTKVTQYPILPNSSLPVESNWYDRIIISRLNLSHNYISFISPYAFLGMIYSIDLSHNRIEVFDRLLPANLSFANFRTRYIDLSGNRLHSITPDALSGYDQIVQTINLAQNFLTEIQSLRNVLEHDRFKKVYLSENPLNCDCNSFWLRQSNVSSKLGSVRCDTPDNVKGYMSLCYPLKNCPQYQTVDIGASVLDVCMNDNKFIISNLLVVALDAVGVKSRVNVSWTRHGPGIITGYTLETAPSGNSEKLMTSLVHPAAVYYIISDLEFELDYNVCISAQKNDVTVSEIMCASVKLEATDDNIIISKSILIGISSALGLCLLFIVSLILCFFIRRHQLKWCHKNESANGSPSVGRTGRIQNHQNKENTRSNLTDIQGDRSNLPETESNLPKDIAAHANDTKRHRSNPTSNYEQSVNQTDEATNLYEAIQNGAYENVNSTTEM